MNFIGLTKSYIKNNSKLVDDSFYCFSLGDQVEITIVKSMNLNKLITSSLTAKKHEDNLMVKYTPTNEIYFSREFIESIDNGNFASLYVDYKTSRIYVGCSWEFKSTNGVLTLSGFLSANNLVEEQRLIFGNYKTKNTIKNKVKVLAVGAKNGQPLALYYIPNTRGIAVGVKGSKNRGMSVVTLEVKDCSDYSSFIIDDWFVGAKIQVK